ncbi:MAG TPA: Rieske 2Fe-2S domain-containing protein [Kofleriaceae bacterium]|nr:Rieske 2Fe-2S domain-containing protein [Kofleriaceae bacterium]
MALRVRVCRVDEVVDDQLRSFRVTGVTWPVIVTRIDGELMAVPGVCPHEDVELGGGDLNGCVVTCPGHAYEFDLKTGKCIHDPMLNLRRYPIVVVGDEVWVDLL